jgi:hypothetical protein
MSDYQTVELKVRHIIHCDRHLNQYCEDCIGFAMALSSKLPYESSKNSQSLSSYHHHVPVLKRAREEEHFFWVLEVASAHTLAITHFLCCTLGLDDFAQLTWITRCCWK